MAKSTFRPLPIGDITAKAFRVLWQKWRPLSQALPVPAVVITGLFFSGLSFLDESWGQNAPPHLDYIIGAVAFVLVGALWVLLAVFCHRLVLLGEESVPKYGLLGWTSRETRFVGWVLGIGLIVFLLSGLVALLFVWAPPLALLLAVSVPSYMGARFSLVLPATAIGEQPTLAWAWEKSRGNGWRLAFVTFWPTWALTVLERVWPTHEGNVVYWLILPVVTIVSITLLSFSYQSLTQRNVKGDHRVDVSAE